MSEHATSAPAVAPATAASGGAPGPTKPIGGPLAPLLAWFTRLIRDPNAILVKELRAIFRTNLFIRFLYLSTGAIGVVTLAGGAITAAGPLAPADVGQIVFQIFFCMALLVISLVAPGYAATALTGEKETGTYESLILSGMSPGRIVWGKFVAAYASFTLVLVALAPVVGIAFLFGGISPWHVVAGYIGLLYTLAPAIAFGVAISARLTSTRVAILLAAPLFFIVACIATGILSGLGEAARDAWGTGMAGPFWFTDALVVRLFEWDTFGLVVLLPTYLFAMPTWFLLASSVAAVRPAAEDRSTPMKVWALVAIAGTFIVLVAIISLVSGARDRGQAGVAAAALGGMVLGSYALLFSDEPPLPPRLVELRRGTMGPLGKLWLLIGPGAGPTLRFSFLTIIALSFGMSCLPSAVRWIGEPSYSDHVKFDAALLVLFLGNTAIALCLASAGTWLRTVLRNGLAARVLTISMFLALMIVPFLGQLIIEPDFLDDLDDAIPFIIRLSPLAPTILSIDIASENMPLWHAAEVFVPTLLYGLMAVLFWVLTEARVVGVRKAVEAHRARQIARAAAAIAPPTLIEERRRSVPPARGPSAPPAVPAAPPAAASAAPVTAPAVGVSAPPAATVPVAPADDEPGASS